MAIEWVHELMRDREAEQQPRGSRYKRTFQVRTDSIDTDPYFVRVATGIPRLGEYYPEDQFSCALGIYVEPDADDGQLYVVRVEYSYPDARAEGMDLYQVDPLERPPEVVWGQMKTQEVVRVDLLGRRIVNSAGNEFKTYMVRDVTRPLLTIAQNQLDFDVQLASNFADVVNDDTWYTAGHQVLQGQAKVATITGYDAYEAGKHFWRVTYEIHFREDGWNSQQSIDQGFMERYVDGTKEHIAEIEDDKGVAITEEVLLDGAGKRLALGGTPVYLPSADPGPAGWVLYREMNYNNLPI